MTVRKQLNEGIYMEAYVKELVELYKNSPDDSPQQDHAVRELEKLGFNKHGYKLITEHVPF